MKIKMLTLGDLGANCYIVWNDSGGIVFDPGGKPELILRVLGSEKIKLEYVINTHGHFDHILGNNLLIEKTSAKLGVNRFDVNMLGDPFTNLSSYVLGISFQSVKPTMLFNDRDRILLGDDEFVCIHTPGHTPGSSCFYSAKNKVVFTGDTLFYFSYGRTDLPGGDQEVMFRSLSKLLEILKEDDICFPGHGEIFRFGDVREWLKNVIEKR